MAAASAAKAAVPDWKKQIGLEMYTVRDLTPKDYEGTLAKVADIGYKEIEPASANYGGMEPKQFRAMLDRYGVTMPSTHIGATAGPGLEKELEGFQIMGLKYTEVEVEAAGTTAPRSEAKDPAAPAQPRKSRKRTAAATQQARQDRQKVRHEDAVSQPRPGVPALRRQRATALRHPALRNRPRARRHAARHRLGHRRRTERAGDVQEESRTLRALAREGRARASRPSTRKFNQRQRMQNIMLVPIGQGEVDYKPIFAQAELAGMKHFCIEQDNAADWGDSVAAAKVSYDALAKILS